MLYGDQHNVDFVLNGFAVIRVMVGYTRQKNDIQNQAESCEAIQYLCIYTILREQRQNSLSLRESHFL